MRKMLFLLVLILFSLNPSLAYNAIPIPLVAEYGRGTIVDMAWNPAEDVLAVASGNGIWLYDIEFNTLGHLGERTFVEVAWSGDGTHLAATRLSEDYRSYEMMILNEQFEIIYQESFDTLNYKTGILTWYGQKLAYAVSAYIYVFDSENLERTTIAEVSADIVGIAWSPNGDEIVMLTLYELQTWDVITGDLSQHIGLEEAEIQHFHSAITWKEEGIVASCMEGDYEYHLFLCEWDLETNQLIWREEVYSGFDYLSQLEIIDTNSAYILISSRSPYANIFISQNGATSSNPLYPLSTHNDVYAYALHPNGAYISFGTGDGYLIQYSLSENRIITEKEVHTFSINDLAWHPSDGRLALTGWGFYYDLWMLQLHEQENLVDTGIRLETEVAEWVDWSPDATRLFYGGDSNGQAANVSTFVALDANTYETVDSVFGQSSSNPENPPMPYTVYSNDRSHHADYFRDENKILIDDTIESLYQWDSVSWMLFSPNNRYLAISGFNSEESSRIIIWDIEDSSIVYQADHIYSSQQAHWSPNNQILSFAFTLDGIPTSQIAIVTIGRGSQNETSQVNIEGHSHLWSYDSQYLLLIGNPLIPSRFYEIATQDIVAEIDSLMRTFDWRADGHYLAGTRDGVVYVWDTSALFED